MHHFVHLYGNPEDRNELHSSNFKDWEAVAFKHPGYLEDMWKQLATHTPGVPSIRRFAEKRTS